MTPLPGTSAPMVYVVISVDGSDLVSAWSTREAATAEANRLTDQANFTTYEVCGLAVKTPDGGH